MSTEFLDFCLCLIGFLVRDIFIFPLGIHSYILVNEFLRFMSNLMLYVAS
jgi:hypothetical protein